MQEIQSMKINIKDIDLFVYDFDGVMTDNRVLVFEDGKEAVFCNRSDGWAIQKIKDQNIPQIILSTEKNQVVEVRANKIGIDVLYGVEDKKKVLTQYCQDHGYSLEKVVYVGNDINDLKAMDMVGYPLAPQDANDKVKNIAFCVIRKNGGDGVIKEIFDHLIEY